VNPVPWAPFILCFCAQIVELHAIKVAAVVLAQAQKMPGIPTKTAQKIRRIDH